MLFDASPGSTTPWFTNVNTSLAAFATDAVLAFNEPDNCIPGTGGSCTNVSTAVSAYQTYINPLASRGIRLGAPAVTDQDPSNQTWLTSFLASCKNCTIDFIPLHFYNSPYAFSYFQTYVQSVHNLTGKPLWITELGIASGAGEAGSYHPEAQVQLFMKQCAAWLDSVSYVERYAWFGDYSDSGDYDQLLNADASGLSAEGVIWNNFSAAYNVSGGYN